MKIKEIIKKSLENIKEINFINLNALEISNIPEKINGHYSLNIIFKFNLSNDVQNIIQETLEQNKFIKKVEIIKKYINITLNQEYFIESLLNILNNNILPNLGNREKINIEYCSVNPTGYLHVGHARNAILGDSIARILEKTNYNVTKEYYVNDGGNQINLLAESIKARYCNKHNIEYPFPENGYIGTEITEAANHLKNNASLEEIKKFGIRYFLTRIKNDLKKLNIHHDLFIYESEIIKKKYIENAINMFKNKNMIKYGIVAQKQVKKGEISKNNLILLKTSIFGDDQDRALTKANGDWTYFAPDVGYHLNKINRGFNNLICVLGADHDSYAKRMQIAINCLNAQTKYTPVLCQMVSFDDCEQIAKLSKRSGKTIKLRDLLKKINPNTLRFMMLEKSIDSQFVFNYENSINITIKNPTFYCQYAYARACSILRNTNKNIKSNKTCNNIAQDSFFDHLEVQNFILLLEQFPQVLEEASKKTTPHKITNYLKKISEKMHQLWQLGKEDPNKRIITTQKNLTKHRLLLINCFIKIAKECFECLGIEAKEQM